METVYKVTLVDSSGYWSTTANLRYLPGTKMTAIGGLFVFRSRTRAFEYSESCMLPVVVWKCAAEMVSPAPQFVLIGNVLTPARIAQYWRDDNKSYGDDLVGVPKGSFIAQRLTLLAICHS